MYLTRFRISSHSLRIQTGRYEKNNIAKMKNIVCIVVLVILKILSIVFVFALAIQHFVADILIMVTLYDHLSLNVTW